VAADAPLKRIPDQERAPADYLVAGVGIDREVVLTVVVHGRRGPGQDVVSALALPAPHVVPIDVQVIFDAQQPATPAALLATETVPAHSYLALFLVAWDHVHP
jgi:hypothetical protein